MSQPTNNNSGSGKNIDDLFRDSLGKQEVSPSPRVWKVLNWKLLIRELTHFNLINVPTITLVSVSAGIILITSLTYWFMMPGDKNASENPVTRGAAVPTEVPGTKGATVTSEAPGKKGATVTSEAPGKKGAANTSEALSTNGSAVPSKTAVRSVAAIPSESPDMNIAAHPSQAPAANPEVKHDATTVRTTSYERIQSMDPLVFSNFDLWAAPDTLSFTSSGEVYKYVHETIPVPSFFSASLGVAPEMALYRSNGATTQEFNYWANAGIAYHFSRFSVRTGLGIGYTYDEGNYKVQYRSNDSVSYFKEVIGYYPDPINPGKIIYITKDHAIYDSITHMADDRTRNRYTYIQVPLLLGYTVLETRNFALGIEAGPAVSFLINEKKAQPVIDIPNGRLIALQDYSPTHQPTNWQLWIKLSLEYQFTRNWGLVVNPYYKYFITSPTQSGEGGDRSTQAFGVDLGIQYLFGRKSNKK